MTDTGPPLPAGRRPSGQSAFEYGVDGPKVIIAGIDGSDASWRAASYAAGLARRQGSLLSLVYIQSLGSMSWAQTSGVMVQAARDIAAELLAEIEKSAARLGDNERIRWEFRTAQGDPFTGLVRVADELRADAIVIGASESVGHRLYGSVAVRLVKARRWPVTVVP